MKNIYRTLLIVLFAFFLEGCTDLEEDVLDESLQGSGQAELISGAIAPAYGQVIWTWRHTNYYGLQLIAADEAILPYRGGVDWFDGGKFLETHTHNISPGNDLVRSAWVEITRNISRALTAIEVLRPLADEGNTEAQGAMYEMIALRAYLNLLMLDGWGLVFKKENSNAFSEILRGQEAIDYIESELLSVVDVINTNRGPGRITRAAVWGFLARLYLNAAVYRDPYGTPNFTPQDMNLVIQYTDQIINSGQFSISPEYFDLFNDDNHDNPELIFALDLRGVLEREHSRWSYWSVAGSWFPRPEFPSADGTDGPSITSDFYQSWVDAYGDVDPADADPRFFQRNQLIPEELQDLTGLSPLNDADHYYCIAAKDFEIDRGIIRGVIWGPRKDSNGSFYTCDGGYRIYPVQQTKGNGPDKDVDYVNHELDVDFSNEGRRHSKGYRVAKYQFSHTSPNANNYSSIDIVLMRLAEIYLMRAEAKIRSGDASGALSDVNVVRTSRTAREPMLQPWPSVDLEMIYRERGFELYWEGFRRTDQIRFGHYEDTWTEKTSSNVHHRLFPIPQEAIDGASNVEGYLIQNQGYSN